MDQVGFIDQQPVEAMGYAHVLEKCIWRHETIAQRVDQVTMGRHHDVATELAARHALTKKARAALLRQIALEMEHRGVPT